MRRSYIDNNDDLKKYEVFDKLGLLDDGAK